MSNTAKWIIGAVLIAVVFFALPFVWQAVSPTSGFGMMRGGYGHMPMMGSYGGFMPFGMIFMWLIPLGLLVLIGLGIAALIKYLTTKPQQ